MITEASIFIGWDPNEMRACRVADQSIRLTSPLRWPNIRRLALSELTSRGMYTRPTLSRPDGSLWDELSDAPMSTEHAISRFFVPYLCGYEGWAVFFDGDVLLRSDLIELFAEADPQYAVQVVQHPPLLTEGVKKTGQVQEPYPRKNWSSCMLLNCGHPANKALTLDVLNTWPGRDLHAFKWLSDDLVGPLSPGWNYLVNVSKPVPDPVHLAHFTLGTPDLPGHASDPYADDWFAVAKVAGYDVDAFRALV